MKIGILGSGGVAQTLGAGFLKHGHEVMLGSREPATLQAWCPAHPGARRGGVAEAAEWGELLVLAVKGKAAVAVALAAAAGLAGKVVVDACNPIDDRPPVNGVLAYFTGPNESLLERLQQAVPAGRWVKAFNSVGTGTMVEPRLAGGPPTMFICGDDADAKRSVATLVVELGWEAADMGTVEAARAIEPLCMLWCLPGLRENRWAHAFKLLAAA